jgi:uncharacterized protein YqgV (UPF0045/DUF77 family)
LEFEIIPKELFMLGITAQVSFYPLRQDELSPSINAANQAFDNHGVDRETGSMSTLMWGESDKVFAALQDAFLKVTAVGEAVMTVTISNACPWPGRKNRSPKSKVQSPK